MPDSFRPEREYAIKLILSTLMSTDFTIVQENRENYCLKLPIGKSLFLKDSFFYQYDNYLQKSALPGAPLYLKSKYTSETDLPVIYGSTDIYEKNGDIYCDADLFASAFFLASRWEEYVNEKRDSWGRFPSESSWLQMYNLHYRPLVHEYAAFLTNIFEKMGFLGVRSKNTFEIKPTHDVDNVLRYKSFTSFFKALGGDLIRRKSLSEFFHTLKSGVIYLWTRKNDPYDTFDWLMEASEKAGVKSHFYFIPGQKGEKDFRYDLKSAFVQKQLKNIKDRGHEIGIHPSLNSFQDENQLKQEIYRCKHVGFIPQEGRQHYLRFSVPDTWNNLENAGLTRDLSLCYDNDAGFRSGMACEYPVFDVLSRKELRIREQPTIVMERALQRSAQSVPEFDKRFKEIKETVRKYNGQFVFLWHPDNFNRFEWRKYSVLYEELLSY